MTAAPGGSPEPPQSPLTPFQSAVAELVGGLAAGEVMTYAEVAREIDRPGSGQAVANVLRRVPGLPWWRVIPSTGVLYRTHAPTQAPLLRGDGVSVDPDGRVVTHLDRRGEGQGA
jgi:methylated-DNA-protein-cysteine methyltransferase related protein